MTRRSVVAYLGAVTSLLGLCNGTSVLAGPAGREIERLVVKIDEISGALRGELISVADWRAGIDDLTSRVSETELMQAIDFDRLASRIGFADLGVSTARIRFGAGQGRTLSFVPKLFAVDTGRSIIPHGHANMVSAHLPLTGAFRLRQYDQVSRDTQSLVVRPTVERRITAGDLSSIGEDEDNVHWFIAEEPSHTFDIIVTGLDDRTEHSYEIFNLDMEAAEVRTDGTMRVPRMSVADALNKYG
ncbi:hypothetical protein [Hoeflea poritis]|uniref:Uncharacterized protein n=1 Tax=Hoeflea poritis TaxID=2993659 RepID=A0ABT4VKP0_9HYPH|nr:hypothetical protein [Hoeflea poritis]MDA4844672.1 hypothetical protein [Hoeflea poritis]